MSPVSLSQEGGWQMDSFTTEPPGWLGGRRVQTDLGMRRRGMCVYERYLPAEIRGHVTEASETGEATFWNLKGLVCCNMERRGCL